MTFLSHLLHRKLAGNLRVRDFAFHPMDEADCPEIRAVRLSDGKYYVWKGPQDSPNQVLEFDSRWACLVRDVLDGMVLDLPNRRGIRANDLILCEDQGKWRLVGVDTSFHALLRRLTLGLWKGESEERHRLEWKYLEFLRGQPEQVEEEAAYQGKISRLAPGDIAALTDSISYLQAAELLLLLPEPTATSVFQSLQPARQAQIFGELSLRRQAAIVSLMSPDLACELLARLGIQATETLLPRLELNQRLRLLSLLRFPAHLAAGRMTNDILSLPEQTSVEKARQVFARRPPRFYQFLYLTNAKQELVGMLSSAHLIAAADPEQPLAELATRYVNAIPADQPARAAAYEVLRSQLAALPVVGSHGELLGVFTVDLALDTVLSPSLGSQLPRVFT